MRPKVRSDRMPRSDGLISIGCHLQPNLAVSTISRSMRAALRRTVVASSLRIYRENNLVGGISAPSPRFEAPVGYEVFRKEIMASPYRWIEQGRHKDSFVNE
jgi:hypothetical protein